MLKNGRRETLERWLEVRPVTWEIYSGLRKWEAIFCSSFGKEENGEREADNTSSEGKEKKKAMRILVVDDEPVTREIFGEILSEEGYSVVKARDGEEAIEKMQKEHFHIVFLDIRLPDINGVEIYRMMKKLAPQTVTIMMTAYSVENLIKEALELGAYTCIHKPFDINEILDLIKKISSL